MEAAASGRGRGRQSRLHGSRPGSRKASRDSDGNRDVGFGFGQGVSEWAYGTACTLPKAPRNVRVRKWEAVRGRCWAKVQWDSESIPMRRRATAGRSRGQESMGLYVLQARLLPWGGGSPMRGAGSAIRSGGDGVAREVRSLLEADACAAPWSTVYCGTRRETGLGWFLPGQRVGLRACGLSADERLGPWETATVVVVPLPTPKAPRLVRAGSRCVHLRWDPLQTPLAAGAALGWEIRRQVRCQPPLEPPPPFSPTDQPELAPREMPEYVPEPELEPAINDPEPEQEPEFPPTAWYPVYDPRVG